MRAAILALVCFSAQAQTVGVDLVSLHLPAQNYNNTNPGFYVVKDRWLIGTYYNSDRRQSVVAGYQFPIGPLDVLIGAVSGYQRKTTPTPGPKDCNCRIPWTVGFSRGAVTMAVAPSYLFPPVLGIAPRVTFIPGLGGMSSVFHLSIEKDL